jgi:hypothetical protein
VSVIKRLAELYRGLAGAAERERLLEILSIRLIMVRATPEGVGLSDRPG